MFGGLSLPSRSPRPSASLTGKTDMFRVLCVAHHTCSLPRPLRPSRPEVPEPASLRSASLFPPAEPCPPSQCSRPAARRGLPWALGLAHRRGPCCPRDLTARLNCPWWPWFLCPETHDRCLGFWTSRLGRDADRAGRAPARERKPASREADGLELLSDVYSVGTGAAGEGTAVSKSLQNLVSFRGRRTSLASPRSGEPHS